GGEAAGELTRDRGVVIDHQQPHSARQHGVLRYQPDLGGHNTVLVSFRLHDANMRSAMTSLSHYEQRTVHPIKLAAVALAAAIRCGADSVYIEPGEQPEETYFITFERDREVLVSFPVEALSGAATIARLAYIADLDLAASAPTSAVVKVRSGSREADVV